MKLTILGSGTVVPDGSRNSSGYFVETSSVRLMLDCGAGTVHALARYGLPWQALSHIFISHFHVDHVGELPALMFAFRWGMNVGRREPLTILGPEGLVRLIERLDDALGPRLFTPGFPLDIKELRPGDSFELSGDCCLTAAKTPHNEESLAVRVESAELAQLPGSGRPTLCYTGDTEYSDDLASFFHGADLLISECSYQEKRAGLRHLAVADAARMAHRAQASRLIVTHFYFPVDEPAVEQQLRSGFGGEIVIGRDGMTFEI
ncbi:MAG TPA: ribonuclease Z [Blastocatellia bacterium]|nr:ribonuclease Z [Blastocatellia bacterium]